jgi:hypothetical protein
MAQLESAKKKAKKNTLDSQLRQKQVLNAEDRIRLQLNGGATITEATEISSQHSHLK